MKQKRWLWFFLVVDERVRNSPSKKTKNSQKPYMRMCDIKNCAHFSFFVNFFYFLFFFVTFPSKTFVQLNRWIFAFLVKFTSHVHKVHFHIDSRCHAFWYNPIKQLIYYIWWSHVHDVKIKSMIAQRRRAWTWTLKCIWKLLKTIKWLFAFDYKQLL